MAICENTPLFPQTSTNAVDNTIVNTSVTTWKAPMSVPAMMASRLTPMIPKNAWVGSEYRLRSHSFVALSQNEWNVGLNLS